MDGRSTRLEAVRHFACFGAFLGTIAGALYAFIGLAIDLASVGPNVGTALAFLALIGMPALFGAVCGVAGLLYLPVFRRIPPKWGGGA